MTQTPDTGRNRRSQRSVRPEDIVPPTRRTTPQMVQPVRKPVAASQELRERQSQLRQPVQSRKTLPVYSDFAEPDIPPVYPKKARKRSRGEKRHTLLWLMVALICLMCTGALGLFVAPQMLGIIVDKVAASPFAQNLSTVSAMTPEEIGLKTGMVIAAVFPVLGVCLLLYIRKLYSRKKAQN